LQKLCFAPEVSEAFCKQEHSKPSHWDQFSAILSAMKWAEARADEQTPIMKVISPLIIQKPAEYCGNVASSRPWFTSLTRGRFCLDASCHCSPTSFLSLSHTLQLCSKKKRIYLKQKTIDPEIHDIWIYPASDMHSCNLLHFHPSHRTCSDTSKHTGAAPQACLALMAGQWSPWQPKLGAALKIDLHINKFISIQEK